MALLNFSPSPLGVRFANENDVCYYCLKEYYDSLDKNNRDIIIARGDLKGKLTNQKIWNNKGANNIVICQKHLHQILEECGPYTEEDNGEK